MENEEPEFDDCPICQAQKRALEEGRDLTLEEYLRAAEEAKKLGAVTGGWLEDCA